GGGLGCRRRCGRGAATSRGSSTESLDLRQRLGELRAVLLELCGQLPLGLGARAQALPLGLLGLALLEELALVHLQLALELLDLLTLRVEVPAALVELGLKRLHSLLRFGLGGALARALRCGVRRA